MIYTSYYARARSFPNFVHIRVSTPSPKWYPFNTECLPELYPGFNLVNDLKTGRITEEEYTRKYEEKLSHLDKAKILHKILELSNGKDALLLCYEKEGDFCHRHIVAKWLDAGIKELPKP